MLEIKNLIFKYPKGNFEIKVDGLKLFNHKITIIKGRNGSGKSTLGKCIMGLLKYDGQVLIDNIDVSGQLNYQIGYLFQEPSHQLLTTSVKDELCYFAHLNGENSADIDRRYHQLLDIFGLSNLTNKYPQLLSRGQQQRLAMASILMMQPKYLLLDEPTTALDDKNKEIFINLLKEIPQNILIITHDNDLIALANKIYCFEDGQIYEEF